MIRQFLNILFISLFIPFFVYSDEADTKEKQWQVEEVLEDGSQIRINIDWYEVSPPHHQTARRWNNSMTHGHPRNCNIAVINTQNGNIDYPIDIQNDCTLETIQVRYPKTVIEAPTVEAPSEDDESD